MQSVRVGDLPESEQRALKAARDVARRAHAPYSGFCVGAALVTEAAELIAGCNVENASYGLTICAERAALVAAIARGARYFLLLAVHAPGQRPATPCGACRQVLAEFNPRLRVLLGCDGDEVQVTTLDELLPEPFLFRREPPGA
jgi:cytidine deaminase